MFDVRKFILTAVVLIAVGCGCSWLSSAMAQQKRERKQEQKESYTRPKPSRPIRPTVPDANRYQTDKVFLEQADSLFRRRELFGEEEHQIVKGNVRFRQGNMWMYCDSAYYYPELNSLDAFGHVRMEQGDTLFVYADKLYYDGDARHARLRCGPSEREVRLVNRHTTLTTDSLDYDLASEIGWYDTGGRLEDDVNILTSLFGEYSTSTKEADFYHNVELTRPSQDFRMTTDTLHYNTHTHIANIVSPTVIESPNDTILTSQGRYNTADGDAVLTSRSTIVHTDSSANVTTLVGDSIIYDKVRRISRAYAFRDPARLPQPMVLTDTARKSILIGGYGEYDDSLRIAFATDYPLLMEFSRPDTLFLRADTIYSFVETRKVPVADTTLSIMPADSIMKEFHVAKAFHRSRFFNQELQGVADSLVFLEADSTLFMYVKPMVWSGERQVFGNEIRVHFNDSTADRAYLPDFGFMAELVEEDFFNQLTGKQMTAWFADRTLKRLYVDGSVQTIFLPQDEDSTYNKLVYAESSFLDIDMADGQLEKLKMWPEVTGTVTPLFAVKKADKRLPGFGWYEDIRPVRAWYGDRLHWADELGEVPDALERYFLGTGEDSARSSFRASRAAAAPLSPSAPAAGKEAGADE